MTEPKTPSVLSQENLAQFARAMEQFGREYRERMLAGAEQAGKVLARFLERPHD